MNKNRKNYSREELELEAVKILEAIDNAYLSSNLTWDEFCLLCVAVTQQRPLRLAPSKENTP